jgi:hypothetical protein
MVYVEAGLYVRMEPLTGARAPQPQPLEAGFNRETAYRVLGMHSPSETADAYLVLANDRDEMWFICTRHVRVVGVNPGLHRTQIPLVEWHAPASCARLCQ